MIDREIGSFWVLEQISRGAEGAAYRGVHKTKDQEVAIWELGPHSFCDAPARERFLGAVAHLRRAAPSRLVKIHFHLEQDGAVYLVTEYLPQTLEELLKKEGILSASKALGICLTLLEALQHLHSHEIVHGHISPQTVFIAPDGTVKLGFVGTGATGDSASYRPPEEAGCAAPSAASDFYAVGATLCRMLGGEPPFAAAQRAAIAQHEAGEPGSSALVALIEKALAADAGVRFGSALEFVRGIRAIPGDAASRSVPKGASPLSRLAGRAEGFWILLAVILVCLFFVAVWRQGGKPIKKEAGRVAPAPKVASELPPARKPDPSPAKPLSAPAKPFPAPAKPLSAPAKPLSAPATSIPDGARHDAGAHPVAAKKKHAHVAHHTKNKHGVAQETRKETASLPVPEAAPREEMEQWSIRK